jgi:hypothetical protein
LVQDTLAPEGRLDKAEMRPPARAPKKNTNPPLDFPRERLTISLLNEQYETNA